jgi:hypothetical protein
LFRGKIGVSFWLITTRPLGPTVGGGLGAVDDNTASQLPQLALAAAAAAHFSGGFCGSAQCSAELFLLDLLRAAPCVCHVCGHMLAAAAAASAAFARSRIAHERRTASP